MDSDKQLVASVLERGKLKLDPERHNCHWDNKPVTLTVTEFLILQALASRPGVVKTRDALMDAMREGAPDGYGEPVKRYYEELLR